MIQTSNSPVETENITPEINLNQTVGFTEFENIFTPREMQNCHSNAGSSSCSCTGNGW
ncbi:MAG: hypothetical protein WC004_02280 [Candidatus Absconditabacterales bacterium]